MGDQRREEGRAHDEKKGAQAVEQRVHGLQRIGARHLPQHQRQREQRAKNRAHTICATGSSWPGYFAQTSMNDGGHGRRDQRNDA